MKSKNILILSMLAVVAMMSFQNCGQAFRQMDLESELSLFNEDLFKVTLDESLLTANQVYASMAEVTGVAPDANTFNEWNGNARTGLSDNNKVVSITAPMMMTTANLASRFCMQALGTAAPQQRIFAGVNFQAGVSAISDSGYQATLENMAQKLWGRSISQEEVEHFMIYKNEYMGTVPANQRNTPGYVGVFYLGVCTAMLGSYEAMSL